MTSSKGAEASTEAGKEIAAEIEIGGKGIVQLLLRIAGILDKLDSHTKLIKAQAAKIDALSATVARLEAREEVLLAKGETAAMLAAGKAVNDMAMRIGRIEAEIERFMAQR